MAAGHPSRAATAGKENRSASTMSRSHYVTAEEPVPTLSLAGPPIAAGGLKGADIAPSPLCGRARYSGQGARRKVEDPLRLMVELLDCRGMTNLSSDRAVTALKVRPGIRSARGWRMERDVL